MVILFDVYNLSDDVYAIIFATEQQIDVAKLLVAQFKNHRGVLDKSQMSDFATALHDGMQVKQQVRVGPATTAKTVTVSYNKRQFYDRILTPMKSMGLIDYDMYAKTYKLSDRFTKTAQQLAAMWATQAKLPVRNPIQKTRAPHSR